MTATSPATTPRPSIWVREIETKDGSALLDIKQGLCFSVTSVGAIIWHQLQLGKTTEHVIKYLALQFPKVSLETLRDDYAAFQGQLVRKGLLVSAGDSLLASRIPKLLRFVSTKCTKGKHNLKNTTGCFSLISKAFIGLLLYDSFGLGNDFNRIYECLRKWPLASTCQPVNVELAIKRICHAINEACAWYPKRVLCLQRSAVTTCLLRNYGIPAETLIGAQKLPFQAHAWVEVNGKAVNERRDVQAAYLIWERC
jgi:Transglutaminase-like superfamily/Coenzyme PQQ synthesis protein D (PqqD)